MDLRKAGWIEQKIDPADYYENYEGGSPVLHDPRMPLLRVGWGVIRPGSVAAAPAPASTAAAR